MDLTGKTALITGSALRVGKAMAHQLAGAGCNIVIHYSQSAKAATATADELQALGIKAWAVSADLADADSATSLIARAINQAGSIDILINSASIFPAEDFTSTTAESWDRCMAVNLKSPFLLSQAFTAHLPTTKQGKIINLLDASSLRPQNHHFSYTVSKFALEGLTRSCAHALAAHNIQVNGIALGAILLNSNDNDPAAFERLAENNPSRRTGSPDDVCNAMMYFLQHADYVTGETLRIDGGQHLI